VAGELPQMRGIGQPRPGACLDLDRKQAAAGFDHEVDFLAACRSPVTELGALEPGIAPCEQVFKDEVLEMRAAGLLQRYTVAWGGALRSPPRPASRAGARRAPPRPGEAT
jgi:hypothetical protein